MKWSICLLSLMFLAACHHPPFSLNYRDKSGQLQGRWKAYYSGTKKVYYKGRYSNNLPKKITYYYKEGEVYRKELYKGKGNIHTIFFYQNGKIELEGDANIIQNKDTFLYQWQGPWQKYDSTGKHIEEHTYIRGKLIWIRKIQ
ncbi:MAG: hypothetical protein SGJ00_09510 [bacterium]|nr:hypothetical protein [bacterium]